MAHLEHDLAEIHRALGGTNVRHSGGLWRPALSIPLSRPVQLQRRPCCTPCAQRARRSTAHTSPNPEGPPEGKILTPYDDLKMKRTALLLMLAACTDPPPVPSGEGGTPYPQLPTISSDEIAAMPGLPRDQDGNVILLEVGGLPLTIGAPRRDAIGAAGKCRDLLTSCVGATKDPDACVAQLRVCTSARPWEETEPCCAQACVDAYQAERRLGADVSAAYSAVFGSTHECFPGLQELYRAAGGVSYLAPRLAK